MEHNKLQNLSLNKNKIINLGRPCFNIGSTFFKKNVPMKYILIISILFSLFACGNSKKATNDIPKMTAENYRVIGVVHISETDCPLFISVEDQGKSFTLYPMNLEDKYKREGMKLKFSYAASKGAQPSNCNADIVVSISEVTLMR